MKRSVLYGTSILLAAWVTATEAHIYAFSNHTNDILKIRVQFAGILEPWYEMILPGKEYKEFRFVAGEADSDMARKFGLCLQYIQVQTPQIVRKKAVDDDGNFITVYEPKYEPQKDSSGKQKFDTEGKQIMQIAYNPWRNVVVTPIKSEAYDAIVNAGTAFADGASELASDIATVATGGVPMPKFKVGAMANAIGVWAANSLCATRHFDIVEDADYSSPTERSYKFLVEARG